MGDFSKIAVKGEERGSYKIIELRKITYIEADGHFIMIHISDKGFHTKGPLKRIETQLCGRGFLRVHRSFIVSVSHIREICEGWIILDDQKATEIPIGLKYQPTLLKEIEKSGCRFL